MVCQRIAAKQHLVIANEQARKAGLPKRTISNLIARGEWQVLLPSVYLVTSASPTWKARVMAAVLWGGRGAVASGLSAAALFKVPGYHERPIEVTTRRRKNPPAGVRVRFDPSLPARPKVWVEGIPCTSIERMALDVCADLDREHATRFLNNLLRERTSVAGLMRAVLENGGRGKKGTGMLRDLLQTRFAYGVTDSDGEDMFNRLNRKWQLPVVYHHVVRDGSFVAELDFALLEEKIDIEIDGGDHENPEQRQRDRVRDQRLAGLGWVVLRFNYWQLVFEPEVVRETIAAAARQRSLLGS